MAQSDRIESEARDRAWSLHGLMCNHSSLSLSLYLSVSVSLSVRNHSGGNSMLSPFLLGELLLRGPSSGYSSNLEKVR